MVNSGQYSPKWSILVRVVNWKFLVVLSVFVVDLYVFFRFLYVHILNKEKNELFRPCQGYSSGGLWLGRCLVIDFCQLHWCRWFRCCVSNLIIGSFHRLRLGFIFDEFRTLLTVNLKTLALTSALQSRHLKVFFFIIKG